MSEVAATAQAFTADARSYLCVPREEALERTENPNLSVLLARWICKEVFCSVVADVQDNNACKKRQDSILLELVRHDRSVRLTTLSDCKSLLRVADGRKQA